MKISKIITLILIVAPVFLHADERKGDDAYAKIVATKGWTRDYNNGQRILKELSVKVNEKKEIAITAYRGEKVSFVGGGAPPGATNDLLIHKDFYLRVVVPDGKDLRPHSAWWEVLIRGEILQVDLKNKIIVIKISSADWETIQTG
jgi:hypothetical protein